MIILETSEAANNVTERKFSFKVKILTIKIIHVTEWYLRKRKGCVAPGSKFFQFHAVYGRVGASTSGKSWIRHCLFMNNLILSTKV